LGEQIKENELKLEELRRENKRRGDTLAFLMSPQELDARLRQLNLDLQVPMPQQIVLLVEKPLQPMSVPKPVPKAEAMARATQR